jgi:hypothetical protein
MDPRTAAYGALTLSFVFFIAAAIWYVVPWLRRQNRAVALMALLWIHALRYVAFQIYSAQAAGFDVPDEVRDRIAYGDVLAAVLSFTTIVALRHRAGLSIPLTWLLSLVGVLDLMSATAGGIQANLFDTAAGTTWFILTFYVPVLWIAHILIVWQLVSRRGEPLSRPAPDPSATASTPG